jgi:hypothetical protein
MKPGVEQQNPAGTWLKVGVMASGLTLPCQIQ